MQSVTNRNSALFISRSTVGKIQVPTKPPLPTGAPVYPRCLFKLTYGVKKLIVIEQVIQHVLDHLTIQVSRCNALAKYFSKASKSGAFICLLSNHLKAVNNFKYIDSLIGGSGIIG